MKSTQGQPIIKVDVPYIFRLEYDESGREAVKLTKSRLKGTAADLDTLNLNDNGYVRGSNIYFRYDAANACREITKEDIRPITPRESEIALVNDTLKEAGTTYEDLGLAVYPKQGVNPKLWKHLREQTRSNFPDVDLNAPFIVTGLMNVIKDDFEYGLRLDFNEDGLTQVYNVPVLNNETGNFSSNDEELQKTGFPGKLGKGNRRLYVNKDGVCRFCLGWGLDLDAGLEDLADSDDTGRVRFAKNFSSNNLDNLINKLEKERLK